MVETPQRLIASARAVVFDLDGTLLQSDAIKHQGFLKLFAAYKEQLPAIGEYCEAFPLHTRSQKIAHICREILGEPCRRDRVSAWCLQYEELTTGAVAASAEVPGASDLLHRLSSVVPTAILSTTPHRILLEILRRRGWIQMTGTIRGAPVDKGKWLKHYSRLQRLEPKSIVYAGNGMTDKKAADFAGVRFIGVGKQAQWDPSTPRVVDLRDL